MTTDARKRATEILSHLFGYCSDHATIVDAMLAFAAEEVAAERARCAKICREISVEDSSYFAELCAEAIERKDDD